MVAFDQVQLAEDGGVMEMVGMLGKGYLLGVLSWFRRL